MYTSTLKQHSLIENENQKARLEGTDSKLIDKPFNTRTLDKLTCTFSKVIKTLIIDFWPILDGDGVSMENTVGFVSY